MVDRLGAAARPASIPDRQKLPGPVLRGPLDSVSRYPVGPLPPPLPNLPTLPGVNAVPLGPVADAPETPAAPNPALQAAADALAELADAVEPPAMRPNQLFMSRQLTWHPPDAAMMAASWQIMVRTYGEQRAAWLEQAKGQHLPASLFMADHNPSAVREGRAGPPLITQTEPWRFAVFAWGAERLVLKVVMFDEEEPRRSARKRARMALRLELMLSGLGRVTLQLEPMAGNRVLMEVGAAHTSVNRHMREILPSLANVINQCGLTVVRCHLRRELAPGLAHIAPTPADTAQLTTPLFKAMAEIAMQLSQPVEPQPDAA
ncbi:hypothetical protein [Duganella sp. FT27W]|uniref:hypothetical protein n=1 Tax=Duganella sp. FT27W TaxID=2654636 RepID=UPI00128DE309|nr:hypothetical protein [Duganella sp. FT27W]MPQ55542.1 hypothetical protein [Duganella sp. FT27W]